MTSEREAAIRKALDQPLAEPHVGERLIASQALDGLLAELAAAREREAKLREALAWAETFLARHDAFLQQQTPAIAHAMSDAADGLRAALAALADGEGGGEQP